MKLDLKDKQILHELDRNARISFSEVSKRIRLSKNSVINRVAKMEENGIILGYNTLININNLGYTTYDIYLRFKDTTVDDEERIITELNKNTNVWLLSRVEGNVNLSLLISTKTPEEFNAIWDSIYKEIKLFVEVERIAILLEYHHFPRKYLLGKDNQDRITIIASRGQQEIDQIDENILKELSYNARISLLELAKILNINTRTVAAHIKTLEKKKIIIGYRVNLDFSKMGYNYYKVLLTMNNLDKRKDLYEFIKTQENVIYFDKFIGGADLEFDIEIESFNAFLDLMKSIKKKFGTAISTYEYLNPTIIYKSQYFSHHNP